VGDDAARQSEPSREFVQKNARDESAVSVTEEVLAELTREDRVIGYRRVDTDFQATADLIGEDEVELEMSGKVPPKGRSELATASTLITFLNQALPGGEKWRRPVAPSGHERGVDAVADSVRANEGPLEIQVTEPPRDVRRVLSLEG
jgi:hypothetical protein